jgi:tetratricopeptide (TPR) repeat protein
MTLREQRAAAMAAIAGAALLLADPCRGADASPQSTQSELARLAFAPSLVVGEAPGGGARLPRPEGSTEARNAARARTDRAINEQLDLIHEQEEREGFFSPDLADELASLAKLYQERGEHDVALGLLDRARQIVRFNEGLFTLDQAPMIRQGIASREALKERDGAKDSREELLRLARRNPNDARTAQIYDEVADSRVAEVERYLSGDVMPPPLQVNIGFGAEDAPLGEPAGVLALRTLFVAQHEYERAIRTLIAIAPTRDVDVATLHGLEADLMKTYYLHAANFRRFEYRAAAAQDRELTHDFGVNSYLRRIRYSEAFHSPNSEIAREQLELGDWHLLFGARDEAFAAYRSARDLLGRDGATPEELEAFFAPTKPVVLPTFAAGFVDPADAGSYAGYIGVSITLDGAGKSTRVDVTERSVEATDAIVQRLKKYVAKSVFRPRFVNGEWTSEDRVSLRYYFNY